MGLLLDAATAWDKLLNTHYELLLGRKGKSETLILDFLPEDFPHLAGMQYATDVDFGLNRAEIRGEKFISKVIGLEIDDELIYKASDWEAKIRGRLSGIIALESTLDNNFDIYQFDPRRVPHGSNIDAKYVIKNRATGVTFFVFISENTNRWFCRSIFQLNIADYTANQAKLTVLKKRKIMCDSVVIDHTHPNYKP